jgi:hypothetical protein
MIRFPWETHRVVLVGGLLFLARSTLRQTASIRL